MRLRGTRVPGKGGAALRPISTRTTSAAMARAALWSACAFVSNLAWAIAHVRLYTIWAEADGPGIFWVMGAHNAASVGGVFPFKGPRIMNATSKTALVVAFAVAAALLLLFGGGMETGTMMNGSLMGNGSIAGFSWMWLPSRGRHRAGRRACLDHLRKEVTLATDVDERYLFLPQRKEHHENLDAGCCNCGLCACGAVRVGAGEGRAGWAGNEHGHGQADVPDAGEHGADAAADGTGSRRPPTRRSARS